MIRKLGLGISVLALLAPGLASALGVGNYELHSYLNQPLNMDISLSGAEDLAPEDIIVNLASQQEFDNAGVNRAAMLADLKFKIELKGNGTGEIHISTDEPVSEPYMDFLVQILWPTGRILREYTILLDPPSYGSTASAPVVSAPAASAPQTVVTQPTPATVSASSQPAQPAASVSQLPAVESAATSASSQSYTVKQGDTLWRIASQYRPSNNVSVQQMVIAIEKANPEAFYVKGNANFVNSGAVLRIPDESTVRQYDTRDAMEHLARQNRHWRELLAERGISVPTSEQINAGSSQVQRGTGGSNAASHGEVKLLAGQAGATGAASGSGSADKAQLNNQLALKAENVDRLTQENQELSSRIDALKQQVSTSDKLLKLRNDQIVALQDKLRELQKQGVKVDASLLKAVDEKAGQPAATGAVVAPVVNPAPATAVPAEKTAEATAAAKPEAGAATPAPQAETKPAAKPAPVAKPKPVKAEEPQGLMGFISQNLMLVGGVLLLILLVLAALVMRSRKQAAEETTFADDDHDAGGDDDFIGGGLMADDEDDHQEAAVAGDDEDAEAPAETRSQDPLDELDVYIAYGRFPQAIDFLRNEIERAPHRADLKVRLLEVEKEAGDDNAFAKDAARFAGDKGDIDACIARLGGVAAGEEPSLDDLESDLSLNDFSAPVDHAEQHDADTGLDDLGDFSLGEEPLADVGTDIKVSARDDKPVDFSGDREDVAQPEEAFELDDAFTLDEGDLPGSIQEDTLSDADVSAMDSDDQGLDLNADFDLDDAPAAADDLSLELADDEPAHAETELSLDDLEEDAPVEELYLEEPTPAPAPEPIQPPVSASRDDDLDLGGDDDFAFLGDTDENATKLDLARAYIDMGDHEGAKDILNEVISEGNDQQQSEARELLSQVG